MRSILFFLFTITLTFSIFAKEFKKTNYNSECSILSIPCNTIVSIVGSYRNEKTQDNVAIQDAVNQAVIFLDGMQIEVAYKIDKRNYNTKIYTDYVYSFNEQKANTLKEKANIIQKIQTETGAWIYFIEIDGLPKITRSEYFGINANTNPSSEKKTNWIKELPKSDKFDFDTGTRTKSTNYATSSFNSFISGVCELAKNKNMVLIDIDKNHKIETTSFSKTTQKQVSVSYSNVKLNGLFIIDRYINEKGVIYTLVGCSK